MTRLEMIKAAAKKVEKEQAFKAKIKKKSRIARLNADSDIAKLVAKEKAFDETIAKLDENYNQWTDSSKYAETYYGEIYRETTRFDNEWN